MFHYVLVNLYSLYFSLKNRYIGYGKNVQPAGWATAINNRQTIHISIFIIALLTFFTSISEIQAENYIDKTLLTDLIKPEFSEEALITETADANPPTNGATKMQKPIKYSKTGYLETAKSSLVFLSEEEILQEQISGALAQGGSAIIKQNIATTDIERRARIKEEIYIVQPGDTVTSIARQFDVSVNTILWENNLSAYSIIRPGKELTILPTTGLNHTVEKNDTITKLAKTYQVEPESILESNKLLDASEIKVGQRLFIAEGLKPKPARAIRYYQPSSGFVAAPRGGKYIWPTTNYHITQYFTWRHYGLDVGNKLGQPIYASADGEVTLSSQGRWNGGYGNQIIINHGNGVKTRYAHNSYNLVNVGQKVVQGQVIAAIGSTGRSSGPHVHFEIMINNRRVNPLNYLSR